MGIGNLGYFAGGLAQADPVGMYQRGQEIAFRNYAAQQEMLRRRAQAAAYQSFLARQQQGPMGVPPGYPMAAPPQGAAPMGQASMGLPPVPPPYQPGVANLGTGAGMGGYGSPWQVPPPPQAAGTAPQMPVPQPPPQSIPQAQGVTPQAPQQQDQPQDLVTRLGLNNPAFDPNKIVAEAAQKIMAADPSLPPDAAFEAVQMRIGLMQGVERPLKDALVYAAAEARANATLGAAQIRGGAAENVAQTQADSRRYMVDTRTAAQRDIAETQADAKKFSATESAGAKTQAAQTTADASRYRTDQNVGQREADRASREKLKMQELDASMQRLKYRLSGSAKISPNQRAAVQSMLTKLRADRQVLVDKITIWQKANAGLLKEPPKELTDALEEADKRISSYMEDVSNRYQAGGDNQEEMYQNAVNAYINNRPRDQIMKVGQSIGLDPQELSRRLNEADKNRGQ